MNTIIPLWEAKQKLKEKEASQEENELTDQEAINKKKKEKQDAERKKRNDSVAREYKLRTKSGK